MAHRLFSTASVFIAHQISALSCRRGYTAAAASQSAFRNTAALKLQGSEESAKAAAAAWAPDPVTGYYRPENLTKEIDAVELRRIMLIKRRY